MNTRSASPPHLLLLKALQASWSPKTAVAPESYSTENPARGQCNSSSLIVQDYYGGDIQRYRARYPDGRSEIHYCNVLPDGTEVDTTRSQYREPIQLVAEPPDLKGFATIRDKFLHDTETRASYLLLKRRVDRHLKQYVATQNLLD